MALQRRGRIAIERRADRLRQIDQIHRLGVQHAVAIVEMIHGAAQTQLLSSSGSRMNDFLAPLGAAGARIRAVGRIEHARRAAARCGLGVGCAAATVGRLRCGRRQVERTLAAAAGQRQHGDAKQDHGPSRRRQD